MRFVLVDNKGDIFTKEFATKEEAIAQGKIDWSHLTEKEQKNRKEFYVLESVNPDEEAINHLDGNPVYIWTCSDTFWLFDGNECQDRHATWLSLLTYFEPNEDAADYEDAKRIYDKIATFDDLLYYVDRYVNHSDDWIGHNYRIEKL